MNTILTSPRFIQSPHIFRSEAVWFWCRAAVLLLLALHTELVSAQAPAPPIISPAPGALTCPITVTVSATTPGARIVVTTDGSAPSPTTTPSANPSTFTINSGTTFRAIAQGPSGASQQGTFVSSIEADASFKCKVWGFADLHAHPATHLAFGADSNGNNGLFWGKPASTDPNGNLLGVASLDLSTALQSCDRLDHNNGAIDPVQVLTDSVLLSQFDGTVKTPLNHQPFNHGSGGWSDNQAGVGGVFNSWPAAMSVDHQQMDLSSIQRAWQGGLRLMFASVTEDELVAKLWNQKFNQFGNSPPSHDPNWDFLSAIAQIGYITDMVNANASWMEIVTSPSQARDAINPGPGKQGKLAVVLSLEMDSLLQWQVLFLVQNMNVRHVIPIHLVDNSFGGTAIYSDFFDSENAFFNGGQFYQATTDSHVGYQMTTIPSILIAIPGTGIDLASAAIPLNPGVPLLTLYPCPLTLLGIPPIACDSFPGEFGYIPFPIPPPSQPPSVPGQINAKGLNKAAFLSLMQAQCGPQPCALLLDVVHMGVNSANDAITLALQNKYPVMDSHTGIRCDGPPSLNPQTTQPCSVYINPSNTATISFGLPSPCVNGPNSTLPLSVNERSLPISQLLQISQLGGVIGLGEVSGGEGSGCQDDDPVGTWAINYAAAWTLMGNKGVALGTDTNGLSPLIPYDNVPTTYSLPVPNGAPASVPSLQNFQLGNRVFDFQKDGIATYGMLPDFLQAVSQRSSTTTLPINNMLASIYNSAEDTIEMWEKVALSAATFPPSGTAQIPSSCVTSANWPLNGANTGPMLDVPVMFDTAVFDQNKNPMTIPLQIAYSGNVPHPSPHSMTGYDVVNGFTPKTPGTYTLEATITIPSGSPLSCTAAQFSLGPIISSITSPMALSDALLGIGWEPLVNADGTTQLTLQGQGFLSAVSVFFAGTSSPVPVTPTNDTTLTINAPPRNGASLWDPVPLYIMSSSGLKSNSVSIVYFSPLVPYVYSYSSRDCKGVASFSVEASVPDATGGFVKTGYVQFRLGGNILNLQIQQPVYDAGLTGSISSLTPPNQTAYMGSAVYSAFIPSPHPLPGPVPSRSQSFTVSVPPALSGSASLACHDFDHVVVKAGIGQIFDLRGICVACSLQDLPTDFGDNKYYIDDLSALGALAAFHLAHGMFFPEMPVSRGMFQYALGKVVSSKLSRLLPGTNSSEKSLQAPITRGDAARFVTGLVSVEGATGDAAMRTNALVHAGYLHAVKGAPAEEQPLTRIEMVNLLWHVARLHATALALHSKLAVNH